MVDEGRVATEPRADEPGAAPGPSEQHAHDIYTVANIITVLRLILVPYFFSVLLFGKSDTLAFLLFALAASTDWLDGQIARRTGTVTVIGKAIDPLVDRLLIASGVIGLYMEKRLPLWIVLVLVVRDVYLLYGAWRLEKHHMRMAVNFLGKTTTAVLLSGFALLILGWPKSAGLGLALSPQVVTNLPGLGSASVSWGIWLVYVGILLSLTTAVQYTFSARRMVSTSGTRQA